MVCGFKNLAAFGDVEEFILFIEINGLKGTQEDLINFTHFPYHKKLNTFRRFIL